MLVLLNKRLFFRSKCSRNDGRRYQRCNYCQDSVGHLKSNIFFKLLIAYFSNALRYLLGFIVNKCYTEKPEHKRAYTRSKGG